MGRQEVYQGVYRCPASLEKLKIDLQMPQIAHSDRLCPPRNPHLQSPNLGSAQPNSKEYSKDHLHLHRQRFGLKRSRTFVSPFERSPSSSLTSLFSQDNPTSLAVLYPHEPVSFDLTGSVPSSHSRVTVRTAKVSLFAELAQPRIQLTSSPLTSTSRSSTTSNYAV
jgi:hypothetical protein